MNLIKLWEIAEDRGGWCVAVHGVAESDMAERLNNVTINRHIDVFKSEKVTDSGRCLCAQRGEIKVVSPDALPKHRPREEINATGVPVGDGTFAQIVCCCPGLMGTWGHARWC